MKSKAAAAAPARNKSTEVFIEHKKKKKWTDEKSGHPCFFLFARSLLMNLGGLKYWDWACFKETSDDNIEVARLSHICWLDVTARFKMSDLSPGVVYEAVYVVKLTNGASGWEEPLSLRLLLPGRRVQRRRITLLEKPRGEWMEVVVGNFFTEKDERDVSVELSQIGGHWKTGLIIKGVILRPKDNLTPWEKQNFKNKVSIAIA